VIYGNREIVRSKERFELYATLAIISWVGLAAFPLFWIAKLGIAFAIGYVVCHVVYTVIFGLTICPACAIRDICPGGKFQSWVRQRRGETGRE
jgi:hypothetical protein